MEIPVQILNDMANHSQIPGACRYHTWAWDVSLRSWYCENCPAEFTRRSAVKWGQMGSTVGKAARGSPSDGGSTPPASTKPSSPKGKATAP